MKNKRRLKAELRGVESALGELEVQHGQGQIDVARYLSLKAEYEARKALLEQEIDAQDGAPPVRVVPARSSEPTWRRVPKSVWFIVVVVCLVAALAFAAVLGWLPDVSPAPTATLTLAPTLTPTPTPTPTPTSTPTPTLPPGATKTRSSDGMVMVYVPGGAFLMGSENGDCDEQPVHSVTLDSFWLDRTEVSNAQYKQCVDAGACQSPKTCDNGASTYEDMSKAEYPVVCVDWSRAKAYCEWAGARLPTEAEWEYAARGKQGFVYPWGNEFDGARLNYCDANCAYNWKDTNYDDGYAMASPVHSFESGASWCGALNMLGNVWEWLDDWYDGYPNVSCEEEYPFGEQYRALRGGSWFVSLDDIRSTNRPDYTPIEYLIDVGLRCAVEPGGGVEP